jgi:hypothetical protein
MNAVFGRLPELARLIVRGRDGSRFLHNFCTNDVRSLAPGAACEAFFTDVRSRVLAHGWIAAGHDSYVIWMLDGDSARLVQHLTRYIITEAVTIEVATGECQAGRVLEESSSSSDMSGLLHVSDPARPDFALQVLWDGVWIRIEPVVDSSTPLGPVGNQSEVSRDLTVAEFHRLRIRERFPLCGVDLSEEHLAPEAGRNAAAISYQKGCYLGQEPIARLDALGHVNRELRMVAVPGAQGSIVGTVVSTMTGAPLGTISSEAFDGDRRIGLAMLRLSGISDTLFVCWPDGTRQPALVSGTTAGP